MLATVSKIACAGCGAPLEVDWEEPECDALCDICIAQIMQLDCPFEEVPDGEHDEAEEA